MCSSTRKFLSTRLTFLVRFFTYGSMLLLMRKENLLRLLLYTFNYKNIVGNGGLLQALRYLPSIHCSLWYFIYFITDYNCSFFLLEHLILQKLIANCGTKDLNLLMQLELDKILAISKLCAFFFLNGDQVLFSVYLFIKCLFVIVY